MGELDDSAPMNSGGEVTVSPFASRPVFGNQFKKIDNSKCKFHAIFCDPPSVDERCQHAYYLR